MWPPARSGRWRRQYWLRRSATSTWTTTRDLVALCSDRSDDPLYAEALQFCYGYMAGVAQLHRVLVRADDIKPVACPQQEVTREELVQLFLDWAHANPGAMDELPAESVKRAAAAAWPCGG